MLHFVDVRIQRIRYSGGDCLPKTFFNHEQQLLQRQPWHSQSHHLRQDVLYRYFPSCSRFPRGMNVRKGISMVILCSGPERQHKLETFEESCPPRLTRVEWLGCPEVLKVLVVCQNCERVLGTLQQMAPLLQGHLDHQQLLITHIIVPFRGSQLLWEEGTGVLLAILCLLGQESNASTSTIKGHSGSGSVKMGAEVNLYLSSWKVDSAQGNHWKRVLEDVSW